MYALLIFLQHIADKPTITNIASDSGNSAMLNLIITTIVSGLAGSFITRAFIKPAEKAEQWEEAKLKAVTDNLTEFKAMYQLNLREWLAWREHQSERTTKLELQGEKIARLETSVGEIKETTQEVKETLAGIKVQLEQTINRFVR